MSVPDQVRRSIQKRLWEWADRIGWTNLSAHTKSKQYEQWTLDPEIGGILARYMDKGKVRVYIKDTLVKAYPRQRMADISTPLRVLSISPGVEVVESFIKPHGCRLIDGKIVCWGRADDWKSILMALHERSYGRDRTREFGVLMKSGGRFQNPEFRAMVEDAARRLGFEQLVWLDS